MENTEKINMICEIEHILVEKFFGKKLKHNRYDYRSEGRKDIITSIITISADENRKVLPSLRRRIVIEWTEIPLDPTPHPNLHIIDGNEVKRIYTEEMRDQKLQEILN